MNKIYCMILIISVFLKISTNHYEKSAMSFKFFASVRFGDHVINYIKSKWLSYKYNIPFYFHAFPKSHFLTAYTSEKRFINDIGKKYRQKIEVNAERDILSVTHPVLFMSNKHTDIDTENTFCFYARIIQDQVFSKELQSMLQPTVPIKKMELPKDKINVAVHIRKGSGGDGPLFSLQEFEGYGSLVEYAEYTIKRAMYADKRWPLKFPPEQFYIDQIKKISEMLDHRPIYVFLFTDYNNPDLLVKKLQSSINLPNITFESRINNFYNSTMIDDFYNMAQFDCLIRPLSEFSHAVQFLGNHSIIIYPTSFNWIDRKLVIKHIVIVRNINNQERLFEEKNQYF